ncbi:transposase [Acinetobacter venetianus]|uniref:transposase n=1 Tax=Acinetobacter venetianus TaxID=52133 RepID=UPI0009C10392
MLKDFEDWQTARTCNGDEIKVKVIPLKRKQSSANGFIWVEVGKKILLDSGKEVEFNQDGKSFYISTNNLYYLI